MMNIKIDEARTLSLLTERPHLILGSPNYVAFAGYILPLSTFTMIFMWSLCGQALYRKIWEEDLDAVKTCKNLNQHDNTLLTLHTNQVGPYLKTKFEAALAGIKPSDLESIIHTFIETPMIP